MSFKNYDTEPLDQWGETPRSDDPDCEAFDQYISFEFAMPDGEDAGDGFTNPSDSEIAHPVPECLAELGSGEANPMITPETDSATETAESQVVPPEIDAVTSADNELPLPDNVEDILNERIVLPSARMPGVNTLKFAVDGHPDLLVRLNPRATIDRVREAKNSLNRMTRHGVNVLPSTIVPHGDRAYVVTQVVKGSELLDALADNPSQELLDGVDRTWKGTCDNLVDCYQNDCPIPGDVTEPEQWMYGTTATDWGLKVRLVDLSCFTVPPTEEDAFAFEVVGVIDAINKIEGVTGQPMTAARQSVKNALTMCPESREFGDGIINAAHHALRNNIIIYQGWGNVDIIRQMRTR